MRWTITEVELPIPKGSLRRFFLEKAGDDAEVDVQPARAGGFDVFCQECPAPLVHERTSCNHAQAIKRAINSGRITMEPAAR